MQTLEILLRSFGLLFAVLLIAIGYLAAPILFSNLDQVVAGDLVGKLLSVANVTLLIGIFILLIIRVSGVVRFAHNWLLLMSVLIVLSTEYWISPLMKSIKILYPEGLTKTSPDWSTFAMWHGIYQLLFLTLIITLFIWSLSNLNAMISKKKTYDKKSL